MQSNSEIMPLSAFLSIPTMAAPPSNTPHPAIANTQVPIPYTPPIFAANLHSIPTHRLRLTMTPTPIEPFPLHLTHPSLPPSTTFHIKRDDQTGGPTSGNKIRKLEFLLAKAIRAGCTTVITAGGVQSNHARSTVVAARRLGLQAHIFLRIRDPGSPEMLGCEGNLLMHKMLGAEIHLVKPMAYETGLRPRMELLAERLKERGEVPYLIPIGGSDAVGLWGYVECFAELLEQGVAEFSDVVVATGSGGTASGLAIGNYLTGGTVRMHSITVCDDADYFYTHLDEMLVEVGLPEVSARDILNVIEAKGIGYARNTKEELEFGVKVGITTGVLLDPVYTLKGVYGMVKEIEKGSKGSFKEDASILFVHTGGIFGLYDGRINPYLDSKLATTWTEE